MPTEVRMPQLGESVTEGTVVRWLKQPGDAVALDESLAEVETEKVNVEIPSPFEGTLAELLVPEGETVAVGVPIATIAQTGSEAARPAAVLAPAVAAVSATVRDSTPQTAVAPAGRGRVTGTATRRRPSGATFAATGPLAPASQAHGMFSTGESDGSADAAGTTEPAGSASSVVPPAPGDSNGAPVAAGGAKSAASLNGLAASGRYSPAVLRLAYEHDLDLTRLQGTGAGGRVSRKDVQRYIDSSEEAPSPAPGRQPGNLSEERQLLSPPMADTAAEADGQVVQEIERAFQPPTTGAPAPMEERGALGAELATSERRLATDQPAARAATQPIGSEEELEPLTPTRRAIANHMLQSVRTAPHAWMMIEVDLSRLVRYREGVRDEFRAREGVDLTYLPFMVKAIVWALKQHPRLNSSWSDEGVIIKRRINIGIAVDSPQGLVVPVMHDADNLSVAGLAKAIRELADRARARRLRLEDVQGGTFTVDNVGPIGSVISQPIINQPQCAIVTMESIVKRPVVIDDAIAVRSMMNCCISFDHRIVDGGDIGPFMKSLKRTLEAMGSDTPIY
ncbi:MAG: dihydrolipoamide acetyltransferase family protein [Dehalococcoidia bacterium]